ncbi:hypothetical protein KIL84_008189 [Mauremys mutica]|uniref:Uncharacterized protein n=1 Tax=Mauremys mutica TaxID=74926 RepID=A0A9D3X9T3_9SAUR|nr:hypothetical protein KIL84_008189 [Mauremys mutica]
MALLVLSDSGAAWGRCSWLGYIAWGSLWIGCSKTAQRWCGTTLHYPDGTGSRHCPVFHSMTHTEETPQGLLIHIQCKEGGHRLPTAHPRQEEHCAYAKNKGLLKTEKKSNQPLIYTLKKQGICHVLPGDIFKKVGFLNPF